MGWSKIKKDTKKSYTCEKIDVKLWSLHLIIIIIEHCRCQWLYIIKNLTYWNASFFTVHWKKRTNPQLSTLNFTNKSLCSVKNIQLVHVKGKAKIITISINHLKKKLTTRSEKYWIFEDKKSAKCFIDSQGR